MTTTRVKTYSADQVYVTLAGILINSGYADGEFVSIEPAADDFGDKAGADGEVARYKTNDRRSTVKLKVMQTADGNAELMALRNSDVNNPNGAGVGVLEVRDLSSGELVASGTHAWIQKLPTISRAREVAEYEWTIRVAHTEFGIAGSPALP